MVKESYTATVIRIDERLRNFLSSNNEQHEEIINKIVGNRKEIDILCKHVNDENEKMCSRLTFLENNHIAVSNKYKGRMELFKWISITLTIVLAIVGVCNYFGLI